MPESVEGSLKRGSKTKKEKQIASLFTLVAEIRPYQLLVGVRIFENQQLTFMIIVIYLV